MFSRIKHPYTAVKTMSKKTNCMNFVVKEDYLIYMTRFYIILEKKAVLKIITRIINFGSQKMLLIRICVRRYTTLDSPQALGRSVKIKFLVV